MEPQQELHRYMKVIFEESADNLGPHLSDAELIAYQKGELDDLKRKLAQPHLAACAQCVRAFKDVNDFFAPAADDEAEADEFEVRRQWHEFRRRFLPSDQFAAENAANEVKRPMPAARLFMAAAAGALLAVGAASIWVIKYRTENEALAKKVQAERDELQASVGRLQDENRRLGERLQSSETQVSDLRERLERERMRRTVASPDAALPLTNTQSFELSPDSVFRSAENSRPNNLAAWPSANSFHLVLLVNSLNKDDYSEYALDIFDRLGRLVGKRENGLKPQQARFNHFSITLPRNRLKEGRYKLSLLGRTTSGWREIARYDLTITS